MAHKGNIPYNKGKTASEETRRKLSLSHLGKISVMKGKRHTVESLLKMSESHKKSWFDPEIRKRIIEAQKKAWSNPEFKKRISESRKGRIASDETRRKMSEAHKGKNNAFYGKRHSNETKEKLKKSHQGPKLWLRGKKLSDDHKKKLSEVRRQRIAAGKIKVHNKGKKQSFRFICEKCKKEFEASNKRRKYCSEKCARERPAWNKDKIGILHHSEDAKFKIKNSRAKQIFPIKDSLPEIKIQNFLKQLNIEFMAHKHIKEIAHGYQCDIFIPNMNFVIECDGDYWHGNINNPRFKILNKHQIATKELDNIRTKELQEKGFKVLRLWESDIEKMNIDTFVEKIKFFEKI